MGPPQGHNLFTAALFIEPALASVLMQPLAPLNSHYILALIMSYCPVEVSLSELPRLNSKTISYYDTDSTGMDGGGSVLSSVFTSSSSC